jgi:hypothetical protein
MRNETTAKFWLSASAGAAILEEGNQGCPAAQVGGPAEELHIEAIDAIPVGTPSSGWSSRFPERAGTQGLMAPELLPERRPALPYYLDAMP